MKEKIKKFFKILYVEIEDAQEDLEFLADLHTQREQRGEITQYVFRENLSLIKKEIDFVRVILEQFHELSELNYASLDDLIRDLDDKIRKKVEESGCADAVYTILRRKMEKVKRYVENTTE